MASKSPQNTSQSGKGTTRKSKGSAEKLSPEEQSRRFVETAKELECDETGEAFDKAMTKLKVDPAHPS